jgi:lysozyme
MPRRSSSLNRQFRNFTILMVLGIAVAIGWYVWRLGWISTPRSDRETTFTMYPGFGIALPNGFQIHGIDVSRYQTRINWPLVRNMREGDVRIGFAFIKATEGTTLHDPQFERNWRKSREYGIVRGAYHFFRPSQNGARQARHFLSQVKLLPGDMPPVLDVELIGRLTKDELQEEVQQWLNVVEEATGTKPILYTSARFYNNYLYPRFNDYALWVAHYLEPNSPQVNTTWHFWQHSERGRVNGIAGYVDFNVFNGDSAHFRRLLISGP